MKILKKDRHKGDEVPHFPLVFIQRAPFRVTRSRLVIKLSRKTSMGNRRLIKNTKLSRCVWNNGDASGLTVALDQTGCRNYSTTYQLQDRFIISDPVLFFLGFAVRFWTVERIKVCVCSFNYGFVFDMQHNLLFWKMTDLLHHPAMTSHACLWY